MSITHRFVLIILGIYLLSACAQVGVLSGGEKDIFAPAPKKITPEQYTTEFKGNTVQIELDEFVQLVNPQQNIVMVPSDGRPKVKLVKKTLEISWDETLRPNTTYSIYMNGLVKDLSEGNDSLMTYVFSTGSVIDSLYYEATVVNSWTNDPVNKCLVGLFTSEDSLKPLYFSRTDAFGKARINNIRAGKYFVKAFSDEDKDLQLNKTEYRAFRDSPVQIDSSFSDSVKLRVFEPSTDNITSFKFHPPGMFTIGSGSSLNNALLSFNGEEVLISAMRMITSDSLAFFAKLDTLNSIKTIVVRPERTDTLNYFLTKKDRTIKSTLQPSTKNGVFKPNESISFEVKDQIVGINPSLIQFINPMDSTPVAIKNCSFAHNVLTIDIDRKNLKTIQCIFQKGALRLLNDVDSEETSLSIELKAEREFGTISLNLWKNDHPLIVEVLLKNEVIYSIETDGAANIKIPYLYPGDYDFRIIEDDNKNGKWDTGNEVIKQQPEIVRYFSGPKVRANWEVESQLELKTE